MLARINPFERALRKLNRNVDQVWSRPAWDVGWTSQLDSPNGFGAMDIVEDDDGLTFRADLPGLDKDNISVEAKDGVLTITGERSDERKEEGQTFHRYERSFGKFCRSFSLPNGVDAEKIEAKYTDGVLNVTVFKAEEAKPRKIEVETS